MKFSRDINMQDAVGGALLVAFGLFLALYSLAYYDLGRLNQMGTGMFPTIVGWLLAGLGLLIMIPALFSAKVAIKPVRLRALVAIMCSIAAFAVLIKPLGMLPAVAGAALVSVLAEARLSPFKAVVLAIVLMVGAWLIFHVGLGTTVPLFRSPF